MNAIICPKHLWYVCLAFVVAFACMHHMRNRVLGKLIMVAGVIAMTMCHRIAGIVALIFVIALLNRSAMEGFALDDTPATTTATTSPTAPPTAAPALTPIQFRQQYCTRGVTDPISPPEKFSYILSPTLFTDNKGKPEANRDFLNVAQKINLASMNKCTPETPGSTNFATVQNMCDPNCNWDMKPATTTATATASSVPTATNPTPTSEGFTTMSMVRPHVRSGKKMISNSIEQFRSAANRIKRTLFAN